VDALYGFALQDRTREAFERAVAAAEDLVQRVDCPLTSYLRLAQLRMERAADDTDLERAAHACTDALSRNKRYVTAYVIRADVWLRWARMLIARGDDPKPKFEAALDDAKMAVDLEKNAKTCAARGEAYDAIGVWKAGRTPKPPQEFEHAVADYEEAYRLSGFATGAANAFIVARLHRANVYEAYRVPAEYAALEGFITAVISRDPDEPLLYANRGHVRMRLKQYQGARDDFETASKRDPGLAADLADDLEKAKRQLGE
jgi:tetratricopeptide (TPR) repeat protein